MSRHSLHGEHSEELLTLADLQASVLVKQGALQRLHLEQASEFELLLAGKELEIKDCTEKFGRLREDFNFNLSLIQERDAELDRYQVGFARLKQALMERDSSFAECKKEFSELQSKYREQIDKATELEAFYQEKVLALQSTLEQTRWAQEEDVRRLHEQKEAISREMMRNAAYYEENVTEQRSNLDSHYMNIISKLKDAMRSQEQKWLDEMLLADKRLNAMQDTLSQRDIYVAKLSQENDNLKARCSELERECKERMYELHDVKRIKESQLAASEQARQQIESDKRSLLDEYEAKISELLGSLHMAEEQHANSLKDASVCHEEKISVILQERDGYKTSACEQRKETEKLLLSLKACEAKLVVAEEDVVETRRRYKASQDELTADFDKDRASLLSDLESRDREISLLRAQLVKEEQDRARLLDEIALHASPSKGTLTAVELNHRVEMRMLQNEKASFEQKHLNREYGDRASLQKDGMSNASTLHELLPVESNNDGGDSPENGNKESSAGKGFANHEEDHRVPELNSSLGSDSSLRENLHVLDVLLGSRMHSTVSSPRWMHSARDTSNEVSAEQRSLELENENMRLKEAINVMRVELESFVDKSEDTSPRKDERRTSLPIDIGNSANMSLRVDLPSDNNTHRLVDETYSLDIRRSENSREGKPAEISSEEIATDGPSKKFQGNEVEEMRLSRMDVSDRGDLDSAADDFSPREMKVQLQMMHKILQKVREDRDRVIEFSTTLRGELNEERRKNEYLRMSLIEGNDDDRPNYDDSVDIESERMRRVDPGQALVTGLSRRPGQSGDLEYSSPHLTGDWIGEPTRNSHPNRNPVSGIGGKTRNIVIEGAHIPRRGRESSVSDKYVRNSHKSTQSQRNSLRFITQQRERSVRQEPDTKSRAREDLILARNRVKQQSLGSS